MESVLPKSCLAAHINRNHFIERLAMIRTTFLTCSILIVSSLSADQPLLHVTDGQLPNDTAFENKTRLSIETNKELGGKALKVVLASGDSFGMNKAGLRNWSGYRAIEFNALNPTRESIEMKLTVKHRGSTSFRTRVELPISLTSGKSTIRIDLPSLRNTGGSKPDLSSIDHWYFYCPEAAPTLYFGNIMLVGGDRPSTSPPMQRRTIKTDPNRLKRIRSAKMPPVSTAVEFDTREADAILSALEVFPPDNPWNEVIEDWPLHPDSKKIIASIGVDKPFRGNQDMSFILVLPIQKRVNVSIVAYPGESDKGPYPVPENTPIEGWPSSFKRSKDLRGLSLLDVQTDRIGQGGDRHAIIVDPMQGVLYEFYQMRRTNKGWQAAQASIFDLKSNKLRPEGWTSADAAGLPIFPAVVRHDELKRGIVEHAMRVTVQRSRRAYVYPATHFASRHENPEYPRMGERIRLRRDFEIRGFSPELTAILRGLKKYGMLVADNGIEWAISIAPDPRIPSLHEEMRKIRGSDFEVVVAPRQ